MIRKASTQTFQDMMAMPPGPDKAIGLAISGLLEDGAHHKQWYLEQILIALCQPVEYVRQQLALEGYDPEEGIVP